MQFLHGLKERHWKTHLWSNLKCLNGRKSFEQIMNLVWVELGNPLTRHKIAGNYNLKSLYSFVYF